MIDILLFLWIFIIPICAWILSLFFGEKKEMPKKAPIRKIIMKIYLGVEIFTYVGGIIILSFLCDTSEDFSKEFIEFLYYFCIFQIGILDMWFLVFTMPKYWYNGILKLFALSKSFWEKRKFPKDQQRVLVVFKDKPRVLDVFVVSGLFYSLLFTIIIPIFLMMLHLKSIQDVFIEQKVPLIFIIFILLFNPIYMFYQLKERLFKHD